MGALRDVVKAFKPAEDPASVVLEERSDPKLAVVLAKRQELEIRLSEVRAERSRLAVAMSADEDRGDVRDARARALLGGAEVVTIDREKTRADMGRLLEEERTLLRALELHGPAVERERNRVHGLIRERLRPKHREIAKAIHEALERLSAALQAEESFRRGLTDADVPLLDLVAMPFPSGRLDDEQSRASWWVRGSREAGAL
jgi:hypothetical protein